ncbi:hypothetical protein OKA05_09025 [Luteolibacter arcticus]|uniref:Phage protein n=1 Tax=Luteolibacter arcticus TaxID=1581411 RepID=A0ABT3GGF4_9BACT|nr:hypothetical protein [Luteolibacter arcticus]MCW1922694.1 hypothetical protein [Luteolibacter arcticus]
MTGVELIAAERARQVAEEGYTPESDDRYDIGQLVDASICYATAGTCLVNGPVMMGTDYDCTPENLLPNFQEYQFGVGVSWPWVWASFKISPDPIRCLVKAGALLAAEIDRLQRRAGKEGA